MENRIVLALKKLFERHRIVFWYDAAKELRLEYECLELEGVEKVEIKNNEFGLKYRILREQPEQKFLLYKDGPQPEDIDNWLLDIQLAHGEFRADQVRIWLSELDLGLEFVELVQEHSFFFQNAKRKEALIGLLQPRDTASVIRLKLLAICVGATVPQLDEILQRLLDELAEGKPDRLNLVQRCVLEAFLLEQLQINFGYESSEPSLKDFVIELFKSCYTIGIKGQGKLRQDAIVFMKRWMDSRQFGTSFNTLSDEYATAIGIDEMVAKEDMRNLLAIDYFRLIDMKIISELINGVTIRTLDLNEVVAFTRQRKNTHWYSEFEDIYETISSAARFLQILEEVTLKMDSLTDGIQKYTRTWFRLDQLYRKYVFHARSSAKASLLNDLSELIENRYSNHFLLKVNDEWQSHVDRCTKWEATPVPSQRDFFGTVILPYLNRDNKVYVIISDALRYEIADELSSLIRSEDRYEATLDAALGMVPSYTQLGMAALLPNRALSIADGDSGTVFVDGQSSQGTPNRAKILAGIRPKRGTAIQADEVVAMKGDDCRALVRDNDVVYVYHNQIDAVGDKRDSEDRVFNAVEDTLKELVLLIKKLASANATNLIVTSDHGFIYQNKQIEESDFSGEDASGEDIIRRDRRYIVGRGLADSSSLKTFTASEVGLAGDFEIQLPKSINRLRLKGSGSRYVHGGSSLQEIVIPVLKINKKRESDVSIVDVEILPGSSSIISAGQLTVTFYQSDPVSEKLHTRHLQAGIYSTSGFPISDLHQLTFDSGSVHSRDREQRIRFILTRDAERENDKEVELRLEEKIIGTSQFTKYRVAKYTLRRSFTSDFDI